MIQARTISRNFITSATVDAAIIVLSAFTSMLLARTLGTFDYGKYITAMAVAGLLVSLSDFGLGKLVLRDITDDLAQTRKRLADLVAAKIFLLLVVGVVSISLNWSGSLGAFFEDSLMLFWIMATILVSSLSEFARTTMWSRGAIRIDNTLRASERLAIFFLAAFITIYSQELLFFVKGAFVISAAFLFMTGMIWLFRFSSPLFSAGIINRLQDVYREALPLGLTVILIGFYFRIDTILLAYFRNPDEVSWYAVAYTFIQMLSSTSVILARILLPQFSRLVSYQPKLRRIFEKSLVVTLLGSFLLAYCVQFAGPILISLLYGSEYSRGGSALSLYSAIIPILYVVPILSNLLIALRKQNKLLSIAASNAVLTLLLDLLFIPIWGLTGAIIATIMAEFVGLVLHTIILRDFASIQRKFGRQILAFSFAGYLLWSLLYFTNGTGLLASIFAMSILALVAFKLNLIVWQDVQSIWLILGFPRLHRD